MPQIWLDADELAAFTGLPAADARIHAIQQGWARMRSRNGTTRTRLPADLVGGFLRSLTQMEVYDEAPASAWNALRKSLLALMPGASPAERRLVSSTNIRVVASHHGIARAPLLTKAGRSEAA